MSPENIHRFWFSDALTDPARAKQRMAFWFHSDAETDESIAQRFAPAVRDAAQGALSGWQADPQSCLALIIVLDQFPRNIHRGTPAAFEHDRQALGVTRQGIAAGHLGALQTVEQAFFLMPFQHVEDLDSQREGVIFFEKMVDDAPIEWRSGAEGFVSYARQHLEIVERFGRFPHRNTILGRVSTPAESEYLASHGESFGQK